MLHVARHVTNNTATEKRKGRKGRLREEKEVAVV
jgi:hypothetical protein